MATFRVGQRVRYVRHHPSVTVRGCGEVPLGATGVLKPSSRPDRADFCILFDEYKSDAWDGQYLMNSDMIEPIQPEGNRVIAWSECLWMPEHLRESA